VNEKYEQADLGGTLGTTGWVNGGHAIWGKGKAQLSAGNARASTYHAVSIEALTSTGCQSTGLTTRTI
jgi:hypothetical protein